MKKIEYQAHEMQVISLKLNGNMLSMITTSPGISMGGEGGDDDD